MARYKDKREAEKNKSSAPNLLKELREVIKHRVVVESKDQRIVTLSGKTQSDGWLFDFRNILMESKYMNLIADIFWERYESDYPFQVGGQETAAIPFVCAIALKGAERGTPINAFFTRKSRKKTGLQKIVEGNLTNEKIVLVDDLINSGGTLERQITQLEKEGHQVHRLFVIVRFRDSQNYDFATKRSIEITSLFTPADFGLTFTSDETSKPKALGFEVLWKFQSTDPNFFYIVPKSRPVIDRERIYFGSDNGTFWALNQKDGAVAWKFKIRQKADEKAIFSSPAFHKGIVYFGAYDGNVYALDAATGKPRWTFWEADWVGSSPAIAPDLDTLFIGLEFGLFSKKGGIVALDVATGKKKWQHFMPGLVHSSPAYSKKYGVVGVGSNNNMFYMFDAKEGGLLWKKETGNAIRASASFDEKRGYALFGSFDGKVYICNVKDGMLVHTFQTDSPIYSTPLVHGKYAYITSMDKRLYCLDLERFEVTWSFETGGRILTNPVVENEHLYIGSNDGFLYEFDLKGNPTNYFAAGERIVNNVVYNSKMDTYFIWTHANELYSLKRRAKIKDKKVI
ncbi:MAG: PQQ-binding-like beta-propeller repeat protein [Candidatus Paceibacterota bacterium]